MPGKERIIKLRKGSLPATGSEEINVIREISASTDKSEINVDEENVLKDKPPFNPESMMASDKKHVFREESILASDEKHISLDELGSYEEPVFVKESTLVSDEKHVSPEESILGSDEKRVFIEATLAPHKKQVLVEEPKLVLDEKHKSTLTSVEESSIGTESPQVLTFEFKKLREQSNIEKNAEKVMTNDSSADGRYEFSIFSPHRNGNKTQKFVNEWFKMLDLQPGNVGLVYSKLRSLIIDNVNIVKILIKIGNLSNFFTKKY